MTDHTATIGRWLDTNEPFEALECPACGNLSERYNRNGYCFRPKCVRARMPRSDKAADMSDYNQEDFWVLQEENRKLRAVLESILFGANLAGNGLLSAEGVKKACKSVLGDE